MQLMDHNVRFCIIIHVSFTSLYLGYLYIEFVEGEGF